MSQTIEAIGHILIVVTEQKLIMYSCVKLIDNKQYCFIANGITVHNEYFNKEFLKLILL